MVNIPLLNLGTVVPTQLFEIHLITLVYLYRSFIYIAGGNTGKLVGNVFT